MIILYSKNKTSNFDRNDLVLRNVTKCEPTWEKNGEYQIDLVYPIIQGDTSWQQIVKGAIVKCPVPFQNDQLFRLQSPKKLIDSSSGEESLEVVGYHITYDLNNNFLEDVRPTGKTGIEAGQYLLANTQYSHPFSWIGDITTTGTAYYIRKNVIDAILGDDDNSYLNVWGGELVRDNFNIGMFSQAGENRGVILKYGKNVLGVDWEPDDSKLMTRAMPVIDQDDNSDSTSGTTTQDTMPDGSTISPVIKLPEKYVDSPKINDYEQPYVKEVQVPLTDAQKNLSLDQKYQIMRDYVNNMYENEHVDVPVYSCTVNFLLLQDTEEYKDYAILETVKPYDLITLRFMDIDVTAELVGYTYDSLTKQYEQITLGNVQNDILRSTQKTLFQMTQNNQNSIKILKAQMEDIPGTILNVATSTTSGGNNLFDHSVLDSTYLSEWTISGSSSVITDDTLHDTDKVWEIPAGASVTKQDIILNPNTYKGQQLTFSLSAKYSGLSTTYSDGVGVMTSAKLGSISVQYTKCLADSNAGHWQLKSDGTGIVTDYIPIDGGKAFTVSNTSGYTYKLSAYDNNYNYVEDFTSSTSTPNYPFMRVEIDKSGLTPEQITGFSIYETADRIFSDVAYLYADSVSSDWKTCETTFTLSTGNSSDVINHVNFTAENQDTSGTIYIGAFMLNTGTVSSSFSQSSNDTVETLRAHQVYCDYIQANEADINQLHATNATVQNLSATYATITNLNSVSANITDLKASVGNIMDLTTNTLKSHIIDTAQLKAGCITADSGIIATGAIGTVQIADSSITDGKIVTLTANKLTAGTIDASKITVTNLDCANLTVGTINGKQIAPGAITATQLANNAVGTSQLTTDINNTIQNAYSASQTASQNAQTALITANGKNAVYYGSTTPASPSNGDLWMESVSGGISPMQYNGTSWVNVTDIAVANAETASVNAQNVANNAQTSATNALNTANNIQVGGRNLIRNTNYIFGMTGINTYESSASFETDSTFNDTVMKITSFGYGVWFPPTVARITGQIYTVTVWLRADKSVNVNFGSEDSGCIGCNVTTSWQKFSYSYTSNGETANTHIYFSDTSTHVWVYHLQREEGNKATDWCPALTDTQDAGYLTTGTLNADRIASNSITGTKIQANTITAGNLVAGTLTSASGVFGSVDASILTTGTLNASRIGANSIDATKLVAGCITSASGVIGALDAGAITTGTLNANRIASNSITSDKLLIGDFTNYCPNSTFENGSTDSWYGLAGTNYGNLNSPTKYYAVQNSRDGLCGQWIPVQPGDQFYVSMFCWSDTFAHSFDIGFFMQDKNYSNTQYYGVTSNTDGGMKTISGICTIPAGIAYIKIWTLINATSSFENWYFTNVICRKVTPSVLIQDGAITTNKIVSNAITTDKIAVGAVQASNILSNTITANQIASNTITATQIASRTITADRIVTGAITANEIASNTITANKILAGSLTSASGVFGVISANNITTGTLNASLVNITNMNASNITSGTISSARIDTNNLSASKITTNGSSVYGTIGSWTEGSQTINGLVLRNASNNSDFYRLAYYEQGGMGSPWTIMNISGGLGIQNTLASTNTGVALSLADYFEIQTSKNSSGLSAYLDMTASDLVIEFKDESTSNGKYWTYQLVANKSGNPNGSSYYITASANVTDFFYSTTQGTLNFHLNDNSVRYVSAPSSPSDARLKTNITKSTENCLETINDIDIVKYNFIKDGEYVSAGVTTQQLQQINKDFAHPFMQDPNGIEYNAPSWDKIMPYTIGAIQQLNNNDLALEQRIATLEATVKDQQDLITELQNKIPA